MSDLFGNHIVGFLMMGLIEDQIEGVPDEPGIKERVLGVSHHDGHKSACKATEG